jgi:hypothetical protein
MTDIRVNSEQFNFFSGIFGKQHFQKSPDFGVTANPENGPFSGELLKIDRFSVKSLKISGGSNSDVCYTYNPYQLSYRIMH